MDAATTAVSGLFYCCSSAAAVVTASDLTTTVVDANSSAKRGPLNEVPFLFYRKFLKSSEMVYNEQEIKNDITKERRWASR